MCDAVVQEYSDPPLAAGMPATNDTLRCSLRPLDRGAYGGITFSDAQ